MMKRCSITGLTRDKEYSLTKGTEGSRILYLSVNANGEAEVIKVFLKPRPRLRNLLLEVDFGDLAIKGKASMGNILTRYAVHKIVMKEHGVSTLGGRKIWFDEDVLRLNADQRGRYLGEFLGDDKLLVITKSGGFRITNFDLSNHFEDDLLIIQKFDPNKIFSAVYFDAAQNYYYVKRFNAEPSEKLVSFIGDHPDSKLIRITEVDYPRLEIKFGGGHSKREDEIIEVAEFIGVKSYKAKGKRLSNYEVSLVKELEPLRTKAEEEKLKQEEEKNSNVTPDQDLDLNGEQMTLEL